jgi:hypothetical protein
MHSRQRGAAHVPIIYFFLTLVLALGALGFAYVQLTKNTELMVTTATATDKLAKLEKEKHLFTHYVEDVGNVFKVPGNYKGRAGMSADYGDQVLDNIPGLTDPTALKQKLDSFGQQLGIASYTGIENLLGAVNTAVEAKNQRIKDLEGELARVGEEKRAVDASFAKAGTEHSAAQKQLQDQIQQTRNDLNAQVADKDSRLKTSEEALRQKNDELNTNKEAAAAEKKTLLTENEKMRNHAAAMTSKIALVHPASQFDGKIIAARNKVDSAYIDLGRKDMLQPGTMFRVKNPRSDKIKAYATVVRVEQERSEVTLSGVVDQLGDAVREGDELYNDLYSPGVTRNIYLMGRFSYPYNKPDLEKLLVNLGNKVSAKMVPEVDLVIIGNDLTNEAGDGFQPVIDTPEYKDASKWGVEFAQLSKIRDLIKL